jgi:hypothetical protein
MSARLELASKILTLLEEKGQRSVSQMARDLGFYNAQISRACDYLLKEGKISPVARNESSRRVAYALSPRHTDSTVEIIVRGFRNNVEIPGINVRLSVPKTASEIFRDYLPKYEGAPESAKYWDEGAFLTTRNRSKVKQAARLFSEGTWKLESAFREAAETRALKEANDKQRAAYNRSCENETHWLELERRQSRGPYLTASETHELKEYEADWTVSKPIRERTEELFDEFAGDFFYVGSVVPLEKLSLKGRIFEAVIKLERERGQEGLQGLWDILHHPLKVGSRGADERALDALDYVELKWSRANPNHNFREGMAQAESPTSLGFEREALRYLYGALANVKDRWTKSMRDEADEKARMWEEVERLRQAKKPKSNSTRP